MKIDCSEWNSRLQAMTSQELFYLREMTKLTQSIGREEIVPPPMFPDEPPDSVHSINSGRSEKRIALEGRVWQQIQDNSWRLFGQDAEDPSIFAKHEGFLWFVVLWDHWQSMLKNLVCHEFMDVTKPGPAINKPHLWNDEL